MENRSTMAQPFFCCCLLKIQQLLLWRYISKKDFNKPSHRFLCVCWEYCKSFPYFHNWNTKKLPMTERILLSRSSELEVWRSNHHRCGAQRVAWPFEIMPFDSIQLSMILASIVVHPIKVGRTAGIKPPSCMRKHNKRPQLGNGKLNRIV